MYPVMVTVVSLLIIFEIYTGNRLHETIPTAMYLIDILLAIIGLAIDMLAFRLTGDFDSKSSELLKNWKLLILNTKFWTKLKWNYSYLHRKRYVVYCPSVQID
jgi:hypothetical protein